MGDRVVKVETRVMEHRGQMVEGLAKLNCSSRKKRWICWQRWNLLGFKVEEGERRAFAVPLAQGEMVAGQVLLTLGICLRFLTYNQERNHQKRGGYKRNHTPECCWKSRARGKGRRTQRGQTCQWV